MTTYTGGCHCGQIAFEVDAEIDKVIDCNCSMCAKRGGLLAFVPADRLRLETAATQLATYTFNQHRIQHHFCPVCGIAPLGRGSDRAGNAMWAINVRCLDGIDLQKLDVQHYDGLSA
ncbi:MAG TPA: GFA family protein [Dokdonella sp.]